MNLSEFINRALAHFEKTETAIVTTPEQAAKIADLESKLSEAKAAADGFADMTTALQKELGDLQKAVAEKDGQIATLKASLDSEKKRTDETLSAMGVPAKDIPISSPNASEDILAKLEAITDPVRRQVFWKEHKKEIAKALRK